MFCGKRLTGGDTELGPQLAELRKGFRGRPYNGLIQHQIRTQDLARLQQALQYEIQTLPEGVAPEVHGLLLYFSSLASNPKFWQWDCADTFDHVISKASEALTKHGLPKDDTVLFSVFQIVTLYFAELASRDSNARKSMGIKKGLFS
jgi:hypothetical protein